MDLPELDETGLIIDGCIKAQTDNQDDFLEFVSLYLGQIIKGLHLPWMVTDKKKTLDDGPRYSREMFVTTGFATVLWGEVSHSKSIDEMRRGLVTRVRQEATNHNRHFAFAFASSNKEEIVEIEYWKIEPDWTSYRVGGRKLRYSDQGEIMDFFRDIASNWHLSAR